MTTELATPIEVTEILDAEGINVTRILNPFNAREFVRETLPCTCGSLAEYFPVGSAEVVVSLNGKIVPVDKYPVTYPEAGDSVVVCPVPAHGGGGSKNILSMVAMLAVAVFVPELVAGLGSSMGLGTFGTAALKIGMTLAGSMLVHTIFAPSKATSTAASTSTNSYGIDGAKNTSTEGMVVPVNYGRFRMAGNIIAMHVDNEGDDAQTLYMLLNAGEGPVSSLTDIEINENPVSDYQGVEVQTRLGLESQEVIPWFADQITPFNLSAKLSTNWTNYTTVASVDKIRLDFVAPNGLFQIDTKTGATNQFTVPLEIQYAPTGSGAWQTMASANMVESSRAVSPVISGSVTASGTAQIGNTAQVGNSGSGWAPGVMTDSNGTLWQTQADGTQQPIGNAPNGGTGAAVTGWVYSDDHTAVSAADLAYIQKNGFTEATASPTVPVYTQITGGNGAMSAASRSAVRRSYDTGHITAGIYDVRARRTVVKSTDTTVSDEVYLSDVNEIQLDPVAFNNTALVGLKIKLGDQINGIPNVTFMNGGKLIQVYGRPTSIATVDQWYLGPGTNPASIVWDMATNTRYGAGMQTSRLDFYAFNQWYQFCEQYSLKWNGPLDQELNFWDAAQYVLRVGHAQLVNIGTRYSVVVEQPDLPVMMFSVANMVQGTYTENWLSMQDRANEVDVTFFDATDKYKQRTIKVYDPAALTAGQQQRTSSVTLYGVTEYERAYEEGMFMMNLNRYILKTIQFQAPIEALACSVGSLVYVQHDMPNWAQAGRFEAGCTTTQLVLDRPVTMVAGTSYKVLVQHDFVGRWNGTITNIVGNTVFVSGYLANMQGMRMRVVGGVDVAIQSRFDGSVAVDTTVGLAIGQTVEIFDTDVIQEADVVFVAGDSTTITVTAPLFYAPAQYGQWMFGDIAKVKAPFRIKSITHASADNLRQIEAVQYSDQIYDFTRFASQHVPITGTGVSAIGEVQNLQLYEETRIADTQILSEVVATWTPPQTGLYAGADIYLKRNDDKDFSLYGTVTHRTSATGKAVRGDSLTIKVVAFDIYGNRAAMQGAPEASYKVVGEISGIDVGNVTGADVIWSGRDCRLVWRYNSATHSYEFGNEPVGADAGSLDPQFMDYEVSVWHTADALTAPPRRVEHTTDNSYTYTFDKNFTDVLERNLRFQIRMRDRFNNLGKPTIITAYNPPPTVTSFNVAPTFESALLKYEHSNDADFAGAMIWLSETATDISGDIYSAAMNPFLVYSGPDSQVNLTKLMFDQAYYVRVACFDAFGASELMPSAVLTFRTTVFDVNAIAAGVLSDSKLIPALQTRINLIDGPDTDPASVNGRIKTSLVASSLPNNKIFREATMPVSDASYTLRKGDVWYNLSNQNKPYVWDGTQWVLTDDGSIQTQAARITDLQDSHIGVCYIQGAPTNATNRQDCEATGGTWEVGIPFASAVKQVSVFNGASSLTVEQSFTATETSVNHLYGQYTVKVDNNGYVGGFGLASYTNSIGDPHTEFVIVADTFAIVSPKDFPTDNLHGKTYPFTVGTVDNVSSVVISHALIGDATINSAKIGFLEVKESNIGASAVSNAWTAFAADNVSPADVCAVNITIPGNLAHETAPPCLMVIVTTGRVLDGTGTYISDARCDISVDGITGPRASGYGTVTWLQPLPSAGNYTVRATRYLDTGSSFSGEMVMQILLTKK